MKRYLIPIFAFTAILSFTTLVPYGIIGAYYGTFNFFEWGIWGQVGLFVWPTYFLLQSGRDFIDDMTGKSDEYV